MGWAVRISLGLSRLATMSSWKRPPSVFVRPAGVHGELESDKESDGGLCQVREFVETESVEPKVGDLVYQAAILRANTKVLRNIEIGSAAIHESATRLPFRS